MDPTEDDIIESGEETSDTSSEDLPTLTIDTPEPTTTSPDTAAIAPRRQPSTVRERLRTIIPNVVTASGVVEIANGAADLLPPSPALAITNTALATGYLGADIASLYSIYAEYTHPDTRQLETHPYLRDEERLTSKDWLKLKVGAGLALLTILLDCVILGLGILSIIEVTMPRRDTTDSFQQNGYQLLDAGTTAGAGMFTVLTARCISWFAGIARSKTSTAFGRALDDLETTQTTLQTTQTTLQTTQMKTQISQKISPLLFSEQYRRVIELIEEQDGSNRMLYLDVLKGIIENNAEAGVTFFGRILSGIVTEVATSSTIRDEFQVMFNSIDLPEGVDDSIRDMSQLPGVPQVQSPTEVPYTDEMDHTEQDHLGEIDQQGTDSASTPESDHI